MDSEEVWMITEELTILVMCASLMELVLFFLIKEAHFYPCPLQLTSRCASRGRGKIFLRNRHAHGHLHHFTKETALQTLEDAGYEVLDYSFSPEFEMRSTILQ